MAFVRVIPALLLKERGLVKTVKFKNPRYVGDPINAVKIFNEKEVDELVFLDIDASREKREPDYDLLKDIASECFMPLSYGGGVKSVDQISRLIKSGVEKVILNHAALKNPLFIKEAAENFGSSTIVVSIDVKKTLFGKYRVYDHTRETTLDIDPIDLALKAEELGAGELLITAVDQDGVQKGYDINLIKLIETKVNIPIVACGGAGSIDDIKALMEQTQASAAAGSLFVFYGKHKAVLINYPGYKDLHRVGRM